MVTPTPMAISCHVPKMRFNPVWVEAEEVMAFLRHREDIMVKKVPCPVGADLFWLLFQTEAVPEGGTASRVNLLLWKNIINFHPYG